ncbi:MAG: hypothetical protein JNK15_01270, partial [Planctomycetes bacterium]|nr:hypothetical protein [Planctomycetota bacterium]
MNTFRLFPFVLPLLLATAPAAAQVDVAALQQRAAATAGEVQQALQRCRKALEAARAAIGDPDNKVQGDCTTIDDVLKGETFDAGIGAIPIALDHLEYVAEDKRAATRAALETLRDELAKGSRLLRAQESLQELASRCEYLAGLGADDDKSLALVDLAASLQKAVLTQAMPKPDLAKVHQHLARARADNDGRLAKELLVQAKTELAQLQQDFAAMKTEMASADTGERDRGFARFDEAARSITTALARVPATDRKGPAAELATMQTTADERYATAFATATAQRMRDN